MTVPKNQKFTSDNRCPVCNGYDNAARGKGERCWGFASEDGKWANCTRSDHAGGLIQNASSETYSHYLVATCNCGKNHLGSFTAPAPFTHSNGTTNKSPKATEQVIDWDNPEAIYEYGSGSNAFEVVRFEHKKFRQRRKVDGKYIWNLDGITLSLYHQKEVEATGINEPIYNVEGEKDCHSLEALGLVATCNPMGAGKWRDHFNPTFAARTVIVIEDNAS